MPCELFRMTHGKESFVIVGDTDACFSDCKVMVKCVESDGKVIVTHVSVLQ